MARDSTTPFSTVYKLKETLAMARSVLGVLQSSVARGIEEALDRGDYEWVATQTYDPRIHSYDDFLAVNLLKKCPLPSSALQPEKAAVKTFLDSEERCRVFNTKLLTECDPEVDKLLWIASEIFLGVLGEFDEVKWAMNPRIGKHATIGNHNAEANVLKNIMEMSYYDPTGRLRCYLYDIVGLRGVRLVEAESSELSFVPKTAKTHRSICIEPGLNLAYQLALGAQIRTRLKRVGIDLTDQSHNQRLANLGAIRGDRAGYATIDLSSASDSICQGLVFRLFGSNAENAWYQAIEACRVPVTSMKKQGQKIELEKISSMGNGFTFPLETLIFYSLAIATAQIMGVRDCVSRYNTAFYGDDIVVPTEMFAPLCRNLELVGFTINALKSYADTSFRESCGLYSHGGNLMRPLYITETSNTVPDVYRIVNTLHCIAAEETNDEETLADRWRKPIREILRMLPKAARDVRIPPMKLPGEKYKLSVVNIGVYDTQFMARDNTSFAYNGWEGWKVKTLYFASDRIIAKPGVEGQLRFTDNPFVARAVEALLLYQLDNRPGEAWDPLAGLGAQGGVANLQVRSFVRRVRSRSVFIHSTFAVPLIRWSSSS